jgi:hypothetical protein
VHTPATPWTTPQSVQEVRPQVRQLLTAVPAFAQMSRNEQRDLAANMVKVLSYIANPNGVADVPMPAPTIARAQEEDAVDATKKALSKSPGAVGEKFKAGAVREGVEQFGALVQKVDFPKFVGGLIKNVFQAIVESSIEQMRAYGELISNVAKTVDQFMQDNISSGAGRGWPSAIRMRWASRCRLERQRLPMMAKRRRPRHNSLRAGRTRPSVWARSAAN